MSRTSVLALCLAGIGIMPLSKIAGAGEPLALAPEPKTDQSQHADAEFSPPGEIGIEIGALTFVGADFHLYYRLDDSPWMVGFRYLDFTDDFIVGDFDATDEETTTIVGPFARYLFEPGRRQSLYLATGLYEVTQKIECRLGNAEDSATGPFFGGGMMGSRDGRVSFNIGLMFAPGLSLEADTGDCQSESDGGIDAILSLVFVLN